MLLNWKQFFHFSLVLIAFPPLGYASVTLNFNDEISYPTASTCAIELTLPTKHKDYTVFKEHMYVALTMHGGFGLL